MNRHNKFNWSLFSALAVLFVFFFIGGPGNDAARSFRDFWNLGHIVFFAISTQLFLSYPSLFRGKTGFKPSFFSQALRILMFTLILGIIIEVLQYGLSRMPDYGDLWRNIVGALLGLFFFNPERRVLARRHLRAGQTLIILLVLMQIFPLARSLTDEVLAERRFPMLADFESAIEVSRWGGNAGFKIDEDFAINGEASLKVTLGTSKYSGVFLEFFPRNWSGYHALKFSIYNPDSALIKITTRIHDRRHIRLGQGYNDRFNKTFTISRGLNIIRINLEDVAEAPKTRVMDLSHIAGLGIFVSRMKAPKTIWMDDFRLEKQ